MPELVMPRLSDSMEEATVVEWLKQVGDEVAVGDDVAMVETDKATVACEATDAGTLQEILVQAGETAALGAPLARIGAAVREPAASPTPATRLAAAPATMLARAAAPAAPAAAPAARRHDARRRAKASPVARRMAGEHGIDLLAVRGTGPDGRVVKADLRALLAAAASGAGTAGPEPAPVLVPTPSPANGEAREQPLTRLQQLIARRMSEAKSSIPDFVVRIDVDMEGCAALRARLQDVADGAAPSYNDMVVKACALALREFPVANGSYAEGSLLLHSRVNVGVAVAGEGSLIVPTVFDADSRALRDIAQTTRALAAKARDGSITPAELEGATFTVSNLGMFGVTGFTAVINPPQAAILAVGAVEPRPVVFEGEISIRQRMEIALTCDHRILYGADAARFVARVRELLEQPLILMY